MESPIDSKKSHRFALLSALVPWDEDPDEIETPPDSLTVFEIAHLEMMEAMNANLREITRMLERMMEN